jgi:phage tail sheath protein FI
MPEYLSPGVYVEEVDTGNKPIEGVATSTAGFLGVAERGPTDPTLVTSFSEYTRRFGRYVADRYLARGVEGFFQNGGKRCIVARVVSRTGANPAVEATMTLGAAPGVMALTAAGHGTWPNGRLAVRVSDAGLFNASNPQTTNLFRLTVMYWAPPIVLPATVLDPTDPANATQANRREPTILEVYDNLSPDPASSNFYERQINPASVLIRVAKTADGRPPNHPPTPPPPAGRTVTAAQFFTNGSDGAAAIVPDDFRGALSTPPQPGPPPVPGRRGYGLRGLEEIDEIAILCCPDEHLVNGVTDALIEQCERLKDRFAILQAPQVAGSLDTLRPPITSKYGAFYFPWLRVTDPTTSLPVLVPPGGHVAGIYARSDIERGVHKAPANEVIRGLYLDPADPSSGLQIQIAKAQQDLLNPRGVNVLRFFPGRGNLVWGARTTTLDPDWKYVNVRRLFIFVEESIEEATQWVVFEPNDEPLWARVRRSVGDFLTRLWMDGMLQGRTKEEAFYVRCDRTTMTQADIDNGRLIMLIGIAPVKPAEFVIFRIGQWTGGSEVTEA